MMEGSCYNVLHFLLAEESVSGLLKNFIFKICVIVWKHVIFFASHFHDVLLHEPYDLTSGYIIQIHTSVRGIRINVHLNHYLLIAQFL